MIKIYDGFSDWRDVCSNFSTSLTPEPDFVYAEYNQEGYEGDAKVIFSYDKIKWFLVEGSHCSCYGLEGQWDQEDMDIPALLRIYGTRNDALGKFVNEVSR